MSKAVGLQPGDVELCVTRVVVASMICCVKLFLHIDGDGKASKGIVSNSGATPPPSSKVVIVPLKRKQRRIIRPRSLHYVERDETFTDRKVVDRE